MRLMPSGVEPREASTSGTSRRAASTTRGKFARSAGEDGPPCGPRGAVGSSSGADDMADLLSRRGVCCRTGSLDGNGDGNPRAGAAVARLAGDGAAVSLDDFPAQVQADSPAADGGAVVAEVV